MSTSEKMVAGFPELSEDDLKFIPGQKLSNNKPIIKLDYRKISWFVGGEQILKR